MKREKENGFNEHQGYIKWLRDIFLEDLSKLDANQYVVPYHLMFFKV